MHDQPATHNARRGLPPYPLIRVDVTGMAPAIQHDTTVAHLTNLADETTTTPAGMVLRAHLQGSLRILERHAPRTDFSRAECSHCTEGDAPFRDSLDFPCPDYVDASAGLVTGLEATPNA